MDQETHKALVERMRELATYFLGQPNKSLSSKKELRFGNKGSVAVALAGRNAGAWYDHEIQEGGGPIDLIQRHLGSDRHGAYEFAENWLGGTVQPKLRRQVAVPPFRHVLNRKPGILADEETEKPYGIFSFADYDDEPARIARALQIWSEAQPARDTLVEKYLHKRGLVLPPRPDEVLRYVTDLYPGGPAMVALLRNIRTDKPCGIHRTWLNQDGTHGNKWMLGRAEGAAIKLTPDEDVTYGLGIAEGIETALGAMGRGFAPMWALGTAGGIVKFPVLAGIEALSIFVDHDPDPRPTGQAAARTCASRWLAAGIEVSIRTPLREGADYADLRFEDLKGEDLR